MGREIKRVPLDFDHPTGEVWDGYVNPHYRDCAACKGQGTTKARQVVDNWICSLMHHKEHDPSVGQQLSEFTSGLAGRKPLFFGHDAIDRMHALDKIMTAAGLSEQWGSCPVCEGDGTDPAVKEAYEAWTKTEPPTGEGWQVWETVSEGSPVSPVFATDTALIAWLVSEGYNEIAARRFTEQGWAMSMAVVVNSDGSGVYATNIDTLALDP